MYKNGDMHPLSLATVMYAWGKSGRYNRRLLTEASQQLVRQLPQVKPSTMVKALWACGAVTHDAPALIAAGVQLLAPRCKELTVDECCRTLWALAALHRRGDTELIAALSRRLVNCFNDLVGTQLAVLAWSWWRLEHSSTEVQDVLAQTVQFRSTEVHLDDVISLFAAAAHMKGQFDRRTAVETLLPRVWDASDTAATPLLCMAAHAALLLLQQQQQQQPRQGGSMGKASQPLQESRQSSSQQTFGQRGSGAADIARLLHRLVDRLAAKLQQQRMRLYELLPLLQAFSDSGVPCRALLVAGAHRLEPQLADLATGALLTLLETYGTMAQGFLSSFTRKVYAQLEARRSRMAPDQLCRFVAVVALLQASSSTSGIVG